MFQVAIKGVWARKLRLLLTSIAVVLGVGFVSGAFFLTDSLRSSFETIFTEAASGIDVQVQTTEYKELAKKQATSGQAAVPIDLARVGVPPSVIEEIQQVDGVKRVVGSIFEIGAQPLDQQGDPISTGGAPAFAANWVPDAADIGALRIAKGSAPGPDEVMLDSVTMDRGKFDIGDKVTIVVQGGRKTESFTISGIAKFGESGSLNGASITVFETKRLQDLLDMGDRFSAVDAEAEAGVTQERLKARVRQQLGAEYDVITGAEFTQEQTDSIDTGFLNILQNVILGFAAVAVFVGAFTIFNTFTILVGQRTREFGLLRAIGAARRQILGIVILEAIVLGLVASTIGILAGYGVAALLRALINGFAGGGIPEAAFPLRSRTIIAAYSVGIIVTLVASLLPAWRASRLSPLEALRSNSAQAGRGWKAPAVGTLLLIIGGLLVASGFRAGDDATTSTILSLIGGGFGVAIIGIALLSRIFIVPVTRLLSQALGRGTTGEMATRNVLRNRARSASTSSALMIGLALASLVLVFSASLGKTVDRQIDEVLGADITIYNSSLMNTGAGVIEQDTVDEIERTKGVDSLATQRFGSTVFGTEFRANADLLTLSALDADSLSEDGMVELAMVKGTSDPGDGVLVNEEFAKEHRLAVGDRAEFAFPTDTSRKLGVRGIFEENDLVGAPVVTSIETFDAVEPTQLRAAGFVYVDVDERTKPRVVVDRITKRLGKDGKFLEVLDSEALRKVFTDQLNPILGLVLGMLSLSLVIALFGIGNTLALNVFERTREIGLMRAVGGTQTQVRRMIRVESVLVALFGAVVGVAVGLAAGRALIGALADDGFVFAVNPVSIILVLLGGFVAGLIASVLPARRAAKTDVLAAIAAE
ncbi:MAG: putative transporter integral rane protein [Thermoleophilia bacterium]|nr:putative transporter integral rane protein [Thermoleophilia bacterium]